MAQATQPPSQKRDTSKRAATDPDGGLENQNVTRPAPPDPAGITGERSSDPTPGLENRNVTRPDPP